MDLHDCDNNFFLIRKIKKIVITMTYHNGQTIKEGKHFITDVFGSH